MRVDELWACGVAPPLSGGRAWYATPFQSLRHWNGSALRVYKFICRLLRVHTPLLIIHFSFLPLLPGYSLLPGSQTYPTSCHVPVLTPDQVLGGLHIPHAHTVKVIRGFLDLSGIFFCKPRDSETFADMLYICGSISRANINLFPHLF